MLSLNFCYVSYLFLSTLGAKNLNISKYSREKYYIMNIKVLRLLPFVFETGFYRFLFKSLIKKLPLFILAINFDLIYSFLELWVYLGKES